MTTVEANTEDGLNALLTESEPRLVIVKFGAEWCRPCNELQPYLLGLASELQETDCDATFVTVEKTDESDKLFEQYKITRLPTILLFKDNEIQHTLSRPEPDELRKKVFSLLPARKLILNADF